MKTKILAYLLTGCMIIFLQLCMQFGAKKDFHDITRVVTFRHESWFSNPDPDWEKKLTVPPEKIDWIKEHLILIF
jgi:hypothetical protein